MKDTPYLKTDITKFMVLCRVSAPAFFGRPVTGPQEVRFLPVVYAFTWSWAGTLSARVTARESITLREEISTTLIL